MCTESKLIKTTYFRRSKSKQERWRFHIMPGPSEGPKLFWNEKNKLFGPDQKKILQKI